MQSKPKKLELKIRIKNMSITPTNAIVCDLGVLIKRFLYNYDISSNLYFTGDTVGKNQIIFVNCIFN